jgi:hypothetical protein
VEAGVVTGFLLLAAIPVSLMAFCVWRVSRRQARSSATTPSPDQWKIERDARLSNERGSFFDQGLGGSGS